MSKIPFKKGYVGRALTCDVAFTYRMGAGFPGDVNRAIASRIEPVRQHASTPVAKVGHACLVDTASNSVRAMASGDNNASATKIYGIAVRPYPTQQMSGTSLNAGFGVADLPATGVIDVMREGSIMVKCNTGTPTKDGAVYVWCAASAGNDVQGEFRASASAGNTMLVSNARFNGPADANGNAEIQIWQRD